MKKMLLSALLATTLVGCSDNDVADVGLGWFTLKDIKVGELKDEVVTGVTCHIASIEADFSLADQVTAQYHVVRLAKSRRK